MKRINRRQFGKLAAGAAVVIPLARAAAFPLTHPDGAAQDAAPKSATKPALTKEQEEKVAKAVERRNKQLGPMRERVLPYSAEPAFVFQVQSPARREQSGKEQS
jgi:hypothetical protein